jgi:hypothetical protein
MKETAVKFLEKLWKKEILFPYSFDKAKQMEKEQMIKFAEFVATYPDKNKNAEGDMLHAKSKYDSTKTTLDLLQDFKVLVENKQQNEGISGK